METAVRYGHPILIRSTHRLPPNSPFQICSGSDLRLRRFQHFCNFFCNSQTHMSDLNNQSTPPDKMNKEQQKDKKLPPPPEKPEPGDCCGSGCVSCVWDVYYEQLEAYNNLYKSDSDSDLPDSKLS